MPVAPARFAAALLAASSLFTGPSFADDDDSFGFLCGFSAGTDSTGVISQDPLQRNGVMNAGPLVIADWLDDASAGPSHTEVATGVLHCWIQINSDSPGHAPISSAHCDFPGTGVLAGSCQINYTPGPGLNNIYLCAQWDVTHAGSTQTTVYDDDANAANGNQCSLATSVET